MAIPPDVAGTAALAIVESLLLSLGDKKFLSESEVIAILTDAAAAHHNAAGETDDDAMHAKVAALIEILRSIEVDEAALTESQRNLLHKVRQTEITL